MITGITIENFKGIGERVEIELRPITLLFGANSAGKSSILHALHYAREIFERHNLDADRTIAGGSFVDLERFVFGRNKSTPVVIGLRIEDDSIALPFCRPEYSTMLNADLVSWDEVIPFAVPITSVYVEVTIAWNERAERLHVESYAVTVNGRSVGRIQSYTERNTVVLTDINLDHPALPKTIRSLADTINPLLELDAIDESIAEPDIDTNETGWLDRIEELLKHHCPTREIPVYEQPDALPFFDAPLKLQVPDAVLEPHVYQSNKDPFALETYCTFQHYLTNLLVSSGQLVRDRLVHFRYLGPLREIPSREYALPRFPDDSRWAGGLGAWGRLRASLRSANRTRAPRPRKECSTQRG